MTTQSTDPVAGPFEGNGVTTAFAFTTKTLTTADLRVIHLDINDAEIPLTIDVEYSVTLNLDQNVSPGGTVTYPRVGSGIPALPFNEFITIANDPSPVQSADLVGADDYSPVVVEDALDKIMLVAIKVREEAARGFRIPISDGALTINLPVAALRANTFMAFDASGNYTAGIPTNQVLVGVDPTDTNTTRNKLVSNNDANDWTNTRTTVNLKAHGATGDGVTDDGTEIALAVTAALAGGSELFWPDGTYLTTASIANLHSIRHFGPGVIKRGTDTFEVEPKDTDTNIIYVSTTGSDTDDGLSSSEPLLTAQAVLDILPNYGPVLNGRWRIQFAAGTWTEGAVMDDGLRSKQRIEIYGVSVSGGVPTTIFDGTGAALAHAFHFKSDNNIHIRDIKGQDWLLAPTLSATVGLQDFCDIWTDNIHAANNGAGINGSNGARLRVQGGIIDACATGIICVNNITFTIGQGATMLSEGPVISNCTSAAVTVQEMSSGHVDWTTLGDGNNIGLNILQGGRVHLQGSDVKNNTEGARMAQGGYLFENTTNPNEWNEGTGDANTIKWKQQAFSGDSVILQSAQSEVRIAVDTVQKTHTGTTSKTVVATPFTIPDHFFVEQNRKLRVLVFGRYSTNTGLNDIGIDFGGSLVHELRAVGTPTGGIMFKAEFSIWATGSATQDTMGVLLHGTGSVRTGRLDRAIDMAAGSVALQVTVTNSVSGDITLIEDIEVWLTG